MSNYSDMSSAVALADPDRCDVFHVDEAVVANLRATRPSDRMVAALADTFRALGDPTRVRLLDALSRHELCVCDLATFIGLSESAVSHQLRLLRHLRVVRARRQGRMVYYSLDDQHVADLFALARHHVEEAPSPRPTRGTARAEARR